MGGKGEPSGRGLMRQVASSARSDWNSASIPRRLVLVIVGLAIVYEWGVGNEILTPWMTAVMLDAVADEVGGTLLVALGMATFTVLQQVIVGWAALYALTFSPSTVSVASSAVRDRFGLTVPSWWQLPRFQAVAISFSLGGTFVATQESLAQVPGKRRTILVSSFACGLVVFVLVGVVGSLVLASEGTQLEGAAQVGLRVLSNPLPWLALAILPSVARHFRSQSRATPASDQMSGLSDG